MCLLRVVDKSAEARGAWWFFKIHSRHAKKRTTGADDRDILSFPSQGSSGVANILNSNHLLIIVYSRPCLFERLGIFRQEWGLLFLRFNSCYRLIKISNFVIMLLATPLWTPANPFTLITANLKSHFRMYIRDQCKEEYIKRFTERHSHERKLEIYK